jgi:hypothetical protein
MGRSGVGARIDCEGSGVEIHCRIEIRGLGGVVNRDLMILHVGGTVAQVSQ